MLPPAYLSSQRTFACGIAMSLGSKAEGGLLTPTMATFSMRLTKPAGWSLAYLGDILILVEWK